MVCCDQGITKDGDETSRFNASRETWLAITTVTNLYLGIVGKPEWATWGHICILWSTKQKPGTSHNNLKDLVHTKNQIASFDLAIKQIPKTIGHPVAEVQLETHVAYMQCT